MFYDQNFETHILMDSNIDLLKVNVNPSSKRLIDLSLSNGFINMITKSTRLQNLIFSLIDQIFSNRHDGSTLAGVLVSDISDHFITFSTLKSKNRTFTPKTFSYRDFSQNNINLFKNNLSNINHCIVLQLLMTLLIVFGIHLIQFLNYTFL